MIANQPKCIKQKTRLFNDAQTWKFTDIMDFTDD